jgi:RimJ/RimL family protein N-acetyltransferase
MYGPVLQGSCFRLRPPRQDDAAASLAWLEDLEVTVRLREIFPPSLEHAQEELKKAATDPNSVVWVIEYEGRPIGFTEIHKIDWVHGHGWTGTVIGDKAAWGKGIGGEMMRLRADFAFRELPLRKLRSGYLEGNQASGRAQAGAGYRQAARRRQTEFGNGGWMDDTLNELLREDWEKSAALRSEKSAPEG